MNIYKRFLDIGEEIDRLKEEKLALEYEIYEKHINEFNKKKEGKVSVDDGDFKVSVTNGLKYEVDQEKAAMFPDGFKLKFSFDKKVYKNLSKDEKQEVDDCLTTTPRKPSFKVEVNDGN